MGQTLSISSFSCGNTASQQLVSAIRDGDVDLLQRMIDDDPKRLGNAVFYDRQTPLHIAASYGQLEVLAVLLERGADPNAFNRNGQTPLMRACKKGRSTCIDPLLKAGANVLGFDCSHGRTCLHYACRGGYTECVRKILDAAQQGRVSQSWGLARFVNVRDCQGKTALHMASRMGHAPVLRLLLNGGALVSSTATTTGNGPHLGNSPIHYAARGGSLECVRELLAWGADRNQLDGTGFTPFGIAMRFNNTACAAVLNPQAAEPLVWPSPWKFMSEGELQPEAKMVLEAALAQANGELDKEIAVQASQDATRKSSLRRRCSTFASILTMPEQSASPPPVPDIGLEADIAMPTDRTPGTEEARISVVADLPGGVPTRDARICVVGDLPNGDFATASRTVVQTRGMEFQEVCCICFEDFCTIELVECGHQMCATCTLSLCCHSKPNPAIPYSPPPSCPFCRHSIGQLILARPKLKVQAVETKEKSKRKLSQSRNSRDGAGGKGSFTSSILSMALGGSKRHGNSGRIADIDWLDQFGSKRRKSSGRIADADWLNRSGSSGKLSGKVGNSGRIADADSLDRFGSWRLGNSTRVGDADWLDRCGSKRLENSGRIAHWLDQSGSSGKLENSGRISDADSLDRFGSKRLGNSTRIADAEWLDHCGNGKRLGASGRFESNRIIGASGRIADIPDLQLDRTALAY